MGTLANQPEGEVLDRTITPVQGGFLKAQQIEISYVLNLFSTVFVNTHGTWYQGSRDLQKVKSGTQRVN